MELKLEKIIYPIILFAIILVFIGIDLFNNLTVNTTSDKEQADLTNSSKQQIQNNTNIICSSLQTVQPVITSIMPNIHRELIKKNRYKTKYNTSRFYVDDISYYQNYRYNYLVFSHLSNNTADIIHNYSSIANPNFNKFIVSVYLNMLDKNSEYSSELIRGQYVYKLINYENVIHIISASFVIDKRGRVIGSVVIVMTLNEFIRLRDFVANNDNTNVFIYDSDYNVIYNDELNVQNGVVQKIISMEKAVTTKQKLSLNHKVQSYSDKELNNEILYTTGYNKLFEITILSYTTCCKPVEKHVISAKYIILYICIMVAILLLIKIIIWRGNVLINRVLQLFVEIHTTDTTFNAKYLEQKISKASKSKLLWKNYSKYSKYLNSVRAKREEQIEIETKCRQQSKILNELDLICNNLIHCIDNSNLSNITENIPQLQSNITVIERIIKDSNSNLQNLKALIDNNKNMEVSANLLEINVAVLSSQLNDSRIKELFSMLKSHNWAFRENNELLQNNIAVNANYDAIFSLLIQIDTNLGLLLSLQQDNSNAYNNFKTKLCNLFYHKE